MDKLLAERRMDVKQIEEQTKTPCEPVESIAQVDFCDLEVPMVAVYADPQDCPGKYVARVYCAVHGEARATNAVMVKDTLYEIQRDISRNTSFKFYHRGADDVPALVGVWM